MREKKFSSAPQIRGLMVRQVERRWWQQRGRKRNLTKVKTTNKRESMFRQRKQIESFSGKPPAALTHSLWPKSESTLCLGEAGPHARSVETVLFCCPQREQWLLLNPVHQTLLVSGNKRSKKCAEEWWDDHSVLIFLLSFLLSPTFIRSGAELINFLCGLRIQRMTVWTNILSANYKFLRH